MDFGLSDEQKLLQQTVRGHLAEFVPTARVREIMATPTAHDAKLEDGLAELGTTGVLIAEAHGGSGLGLLDAALISEALGHGATPAPFLATSVMAPIALAAGTKAQQAAFLPRIASARCRAGIAFSEQVSRRAEAGLTESGGRLRGTSLFVIDAGAADVFLVALDADRIAIVPRDAKGLAMTGLSTVDQTRRIAELIFDDVSPADWVGGPQGVPRLVERVIAAGRIAIAADVLGACGRAIEMAVAYAMQREQFGRPIATFQAVKHLCAEMVAELEPARALVWYAAHAFDEGSPDAAQMARHAKAHLCEIGTAIVRTATEVHGGIGFTSECDLHLWFKRVGLDRQLLGNPEIVRAEAAACRGF